MIDNKSLFKIIVLGILIIYVASNLQIKTNVMFGTIVAGVVSYYMYIIYEKKQKDTNQIIQNKYNLITPQPSASKNYTDIIDFLFSIQDFYSYNQIAYENLVSELDKFFDIYNKTSNNIGQSYNMMLDTKKNALNSLHSLIISLPVDASHTTKHNKSIKSLSDILNKYMSMVENMYEIELIDSGYVRQTELLSKSPYAANLSDGMVERTKVGTIYSYDLF